MTKIKELLNELGMLICKEAASLGHNASFDEAAEIAAMCGHYNDICKFMHHYHKHDGMHPAVMRDGGLIGSIEGELEGAGEYYQKWLETKDDMYRTMAKDELRHGELLMNTAKKDNIDVSGVAHLLQDLQSKIAKL